MITRRLNNSLLDQLANAPNSQLASTSGAVEVGVGNPGLGDSSSFSGQNATAFLGISEEEGNEKLLATMKGSLAGVRPFKQYYDVKRKRTVTQATATLRFSDTFLDQFGDRLAPGVVQKYGPGSPAKTPNTI